jgi:sugar phosphate isomerase/epimerase
MKLAFSTLGCPDWDLEKIAAFAGGNGFEGVELRTADKESQFLTGATVDEAKRVGELFRSKGTRVFSFMAYTRFGSTDPQELAANRDKLLHVLDLAKAAGAGFIRTFAGQFGGNKSREQAIAEAAEYLKPCCAKARKLEVQLGVETHDDWCDASNIRALQKLVGGGLGCIWDFANAVSQTGRSAEDQYRDLAGTILYCHVKDAVKEADGKSRYVPVGTGRMPVREVVEILRKEKLDLFLSFEHEKKWHPELPEPEVAFPAYAKFMRGLEGAPAKKSAAKKSKK